MRSAGCPTCSTSSTAPTSRLRPGSASRSRGGCPTSSDTSRKPGVRTRRTTCAHASPRCCRPSAFRAIPPETVLEENEVAILLRSDSQRPPRARGRPARPRPRSTSRASAAASSAAGCRRRCRWRQGFPGADLVPASAQLFLGFTSTQKDALGPRLIANHETLGFVDLGPKHYFRQGTSMHVSHLFEDLEAWYLNFDFRERVATAFRPGQPALREGTLTVPQPLKRADSPRGVKREFRDAGPHRPQLGDPGVVAAAARLRRRGRDGLQARHRHPAAGRLQHAGQPVRLELASRRRRRCSPARARVCTSSSSTRRATTSIATGWRWTAVLPDGTKLPLQRARPKSGLQLGAAHHAPPELPRAAAAAPIVSSRGALVRAKAGAFARFV